MAKSNLMSPGRKIPRRIKLLQSHYPLTGLILSLLSKKVVNFTIPNQPTFFFEFLPHIFLTVRITSISSQSLKSFAARLKQLKLEIDVIPTVRKYFDEEIVPNALQQCHAIVCCVKLMISQFSTTGQ
jgi:hypothetical protein